MKKILQILTFILFSNVTFAQTDSARFYKLTDTNFWVGKTYMLKEPTWNITNGLYMYNAPTCFDSVILFLKNNPKLTIEIGYHTDSRPVPCTLDTISYRRARLIKEYFVSNGISPTRIVPRGYAGRVPRIIEKDTTIIMKNEINDKCQDKSFFFKRNTVLDDNFINKIQDLCFKELAHYLNSRPEMKLIKIE